MTEPQEDLAISFGPSRLLALLLGLVVMTDRQRALVGVFVAGDDAAARDAVAQLAKSAGFDVIDAGPLKNARYLEPLAGLNIYLGYGAGLGTSIAPTFLRKA